MTVTDPLLGVLSVCGHAIKAGAEIGGTLSNTDVAEADSFFAEELGVGKGMNEVGEDDCLATGMVCREGFLGGGRSRVRIREDI